MYVFNFIISVPPDSVRIVDETGAERSSTIGPFAVGRTLVLTCLAKGGEWEWVGQPRSF